MLVRFGQWQEIIDEPLPEDDQRYCVTTAMMRYARGVASTALGPWLGVTSKISSLVPTDVVIERAPREHLTPRVGDEHGMAERHRQVGRGVDENGVHE